MAAENIGLMSGAYFLGKNELLKWLNDYFQAGYTKIEECASGAIHVQILDSVFPGVPMHKVKWEAKSDYEFVENFKILQAVFSKQQIQKNVEVEKLVKAKYQDNLEFLQWMKNFWDVRNGGSVEYDPIARRGKVGKKVGSKPIRAPSAGMKKPKPAAAAGGPSRMAQPGPAGAAAGADKAKIEELTEKLSQLQVSIEGLEKERNFYFGKLRQIEIMCQEDPDQDSDLKQSVLDILYATDDNDEFAAPEEEQQYDDYDVNEAF